MTERSTWVIPTDTWHAKMYRQWLKFGKFKNPTYYLNYMDEEPYRENLCHYWRVVLFWAPINLVGWYLFSSRSFEPSDDKRPSQSPQAVRLSETRIPRAVVAFIVSCFTFFIVDVYMNNPAWKATAYLIGTPVLLALFCTTVYTGVYLWENRPVKYAKSDSDLDHTHERRSLAREFLAAKKARICPFIEIEQERSQ